MTFYEDLTPHEYSHLGTAKEGLNIGWLEQGHSFTTGEPPAGFLLALEMCAHFPAVVHRGSHYCDLCEANSGRCDEIEGLAIPPYGNAVIHVGDENGITFCAPTLITHYVAAHKYLPPRQFIEAVMSKAATLYVVRGQTLAAVRALSFRQRAWVCFQLVLMTTQSHPDVEVLDRLLDGIRLAGLASKEPTTELIDLFKNHFPHPTDQYSDYATLRSQFPMLLHTSCTLIPVDKPQDFEMLCVRRVKLAMEMAFLLGRSAEEIELVLVQAGSQLDLQ